MSKHRELILQHTHTHKHWEPEHPCASPGRNRAPSPPRCSPGRRGTLSTKQAICIPLKRTYFSWRGSQSTPGSSSRAAWRTSSLSTEKLRRCPACATATRIHSISGGSTMNGLGRHRHQCQRLQHLQHLPTATEREEHRAGGCVVCACAWMGESRDVHGEKGASGTKEWESKPAQRFLNRSKSRSLAPVSGAGLFGEWGEVRFVSHAHSWGSARSVHPTGEPSCHPSHSVLPKRGQESGTGPCPTLADARGSLPCLFAKGTGEMDLGRERGCPNTEMPRMERECPGSLQPLLLLQWAPCAQCRTWGTLQPMWRLSVREVRNQKSDCFVSLFTGSNCCTFGCHLFCQLSKNIQNCPQKWMLGFWTTPPQSLGTIRDMVLHSTIPGQPHVDEAVDEACSTQFAPSVLRIIWEPRERGQTISKNHSFKSYFGDKTNNITAAEHLEGHYKSLACLSFCGPFSWRKAKKKPALGAE